MKKQTISILLLVGLAACQTKQDLSEDMIKAQVDSLIGIRKKDLDLWAKEDLELRMTIELRSRTDSIIKARQTADTGKKPEELP